MPVLDESQSSCRCAPVNSIYFQHRIWNYNARVLIFYLALAAIIVSMLWPVLKKSLLKSRLKTLSRSRENAQLVKVILSLEDQPLEDLFSLYRQRFGAGAARYARHTYRKWKSGEVRPNKQTFFRFLIFLPKVMSFDLKCEVLRELREAYLPRDDYSLTVHTDDWKEKLTPLVESVLAKGKDAELPVKLKEKLSWLAEDDIEVANAILARSQAQQSLDSLSLLEKEFTNIEQLLDNTNGAGKVSHVLRLPSGTITMTIKHG